MRVALAFSLSLIAASAAAADHRFTLQEATIADVQAAYAAGALTSEQLTGLYLKRIEAYDRQGPSLHAIITVNPKARAEAAALDRERKAGHVRGPLHGIPVLLKDNVDTHDMATSNGAAVLKNSVPKDDAHLLQELRKAGAVILGKSAMGEFAGGSYNSVSGQARNPYNTGHHTGGSSSGSGAAIAANFAMLAIGTDTSTSVRGPSAYNGIVGIRPTTGLISRSGIAPKNLTFDSAGPMARTVTDVALMLNTIAHYDPKDPASKPVWDEVESRYPIVNGHVDYTQFLKTDALKGKRIGVLRDFFGGDPEIDALTEQALAQMRALGATTVDITLSKDFMDRYVGDGNRYIRRMADYRFRADWERYLASLRPGFPKTVAEFLRLDEEVIEKSPLPVEESVKRLLRDSLKHDTADPDYQRFIAETLPKATADKLALFAQYKVDVLAFPYFSAFAPPISNPKEKVDDPKYVKTSKPEPATLAGYGSVGFPSTVVPMGFGSLGLPMDIGFMGKPFEEGPLLGYAYAYEQASKLRKPSPLVPPLPGETLSY